MPINPSLPNQFATDAFIRFFNRETREFIPYIREAQFNSEGELEIRLPIRFIDHIEKIAMGGGLVALAGPCADIRAYMPESSLAVFEGLLSKKMDVWINLMEDNLTLANYTLKFARILVHTLDQEINIVYREVR